MHNIFVTEGVVLQKRGVGEANLLAAILTRELGLVRASARSARLDRSKLRYGLEPLTLGRFSLVRGRHEWKLVGTEQLSRVGTGGALARRQAAGRIARLLLRLIHGEEPVPELYQTITLGLGALVQVAEQSEAESVECILVLRVLARLGYLAPAPEVSPFLSTEDFSPELVAEALRSKLQLVRAINASLAATGL